MHEYRRLVQAELDARGWKPAQLEQASGLSRQLIWGILHDKRAHLGQMPYDTTLEGLARGFGIPVERVRTAAARSLDGYQGDDSPLVADLTHVSIDVLLNEIRRRFVALVGDAVSDESEPLDGVVDDETDATGGLGAVGRG